MGKIRSVHLRDEPCCCRVVLDGLKADYKQLQHGVEQLQSQLDATADPSLTAQFTTFLQVRHIKHAPTPSLFVVKLRVPGMQKGRS